MIQKTKQLNLNDFIQEFKAYGRDNFSFESYETLFNIFEEYETEYELDVIAIDCVYAEYSREELLNEYSNYIEDEDTEELQEDEKEDLLIETLQDETELYILKNGDILLNTEF